GCMSIGQDENSGISILHEALDKGINFFDTADLYNNGLNETIVGKAFRGNRDKVVLATKVGNQLRADGSGWDWNPAKKYILSSVEKSLQRLQTEYIDLYQLHGGMINDPIDETIEAFEILKQQGKIRYYGISSIRPNVIRQYVKMSSIVSVMMQYSLLDRRPEETCLQLLQQNNIGVLSRGVVAQGLLIEKPAIAYLDHSAEEVKRASDAVAKISGPQRTKAQTALRFVLNNLAITSAVAGIRTMEQLKDTVETTATPPLTREELAFLQKQADPKTYKDHR
ncbi:MAG: aldo/keto reductase, partial [Flavitalea sp.]